jgi:hypothetical protein
MFRMKWMNLGVVVGSLMAAWGVAFAKNSEPIQAFLRSEFHLVDGVPDLSSEMRRAFQSYIRDAPLAKPGDPYEATDFHDGRDLPRRRVVLVGVGINISFVMYEHGGRSRHDHLVVMMGDGDDVTVPYACVGSLPRKLDGLRAAARKGTCERERGTREGR